MTRHLPTLARFVAPRLSAVHQLLMLCALFAFASCSSAFAQDRIPAGRNNGRADASQAVTCMDPSTGVLNACGGGPTIPLGYQQITSLSAATFLTVPTGATVALIVPEVQGVRWRDDGGAPTASTGMPLPVGRPLTYRGALGALRFIEQTASATLDITYY